jgi:hypothetical protein
VQRSTVLPIYRNKYLVLELFPEKTLILTANQLVDDSFRILLLRILQALLSFSKEFLPKTSKVWSEGRGAYNDPSKAVTSQFLMEELYMSMTNMICPNLSSVCSDGGDGSWEIFKV